MPLETATYLDGLVSSNPAHTDQLSAADSHVRLIKSTLKATFPNLTGPVTATQVQLNATAGSTVLGFFGGSALLPGLSPAGSPATGWWSPSLNVINYQINGVTKIQYFADGSVAFAGAAAFAAPVAFTGGLISSAVVSTGAYSGGTGQLVPIGGTLLWWDDTLPVEGGYAWANGQVIASANTVCPVLLARWGNKFGGNGTTTMGVPDLRETVPVGKSTMGATTARGLIAGYTSTILTTLGQLFGASQKTLGVANLPPYTPTGLLSGVGTTGQSAPRGNPGFAYSGNNGTLSRGWNGDFLADFGPLTINGNQYTFTGTAQGGTSTPMQLEQNSAVCNFIVRIG
jgi:microcystin-dependent protein